MIILHFSIYLYPSSVRQYHPRIKKPPRCFALQTLLIDFVGHRIDLHTNISKQKKPYASKCSIQGLPLEKITIHLAKVRVWLSTSYIVVTLKQFLSQEWCVCCGNTNWTIYSFFDKVLTDIFTDASAKNIRQYTNIWNTIRSKSYKTGP